MIIDKVILKNISKNCENILIVLLFGQLPRIMKVESNDGEIIVLNEDCPCR